MSSSSSATWIALWHSIATPWACPLIFSSPGWSEFATGETKLGLHPASEKNPPGTVELGFGVPDLQKFFDQMSAKGVAFSMPPTQQDFGGMLARFVDSEGGHVSVSAA